MDFVNTRRTPTAQIDADWTKPSNIAHGFLEIEIEYFSYPASNGV